MNQLHNSNVRNDNTRITQFDIIQYKVTIQENASYNDVNATIQTLNSQISNTYIYHGQTIHRLAHEYYETNYNNDYKSEMSPQIADIFDDKSAHNTAFNITLQDTQATTKHIQT